MIWLAIVRSACLVVAVYAMTDADAGWRRTVAAIALSIAVTA